MTRCQCNPVPTCHQKRASEHFNSTPRRSWKALFVMFAFEPVRPSVCLSICLSVPLCMHMVGSVPCQFTSCTGGSRFCSGSCAALPFTYTLQRVGVVVCLCWYRLTRANASSLWSTHPDLPKGDAGSEKRNTSRSRIRWYAIASRPSCPMRARQVCECQPWLPASIDSGATAPVLVLLCCHGH